MAPSESIVAVLSPWPGTGGSTSVWTQGNETNQWWTGSLKVSRFKMKNKCAILHVCISAETGSMSQWREDDVQPSPSYQHLWQAYPLSFTFHCLKPSFFPYLQLWKWSLEYFSTEECFQLFILCQNQWNCLGFRVMMKGMNLQITEETIFLQICSKLLNGCQGPQTNPFWDTNCISL